MFINRVRRYERLWTENAAPPSTLPCGFARFDASSLPADQRQACAAHGKLYQWAYDQARAAADERFINDWVI